MRVLLLLLAAVGVAATEPPCDVHGVAVARRSTKYVVGRPHQRGAVYATCDAHGVSKCFEDSGIADAPAWAVKSLPCDAHTIHARRRKLGVAVNVKEDKWPNGLVFYRFNDQFPLSESERGVVRQAIKAYEATDLGVAFQECEPKSLCKDMYVDISQKEDACYSYVGFTGETGGQIMNLGKSCFEEPGTAIHELGHALGLYHEHTHPQREVIVLTDSNLPVSASNYAKETDALLKPYDKASIMHYGRSAGLCLPKDTYPLDSFCDVEVTTNCVMPKKTHCNNTRNSEIGQRSALSPGDINTLKSIYGTQKPTLKPSEAPSPSSSAPSSSPSPEPSSSSPSSSPSPPPTSKAPETSSPPSSSPSPPPTSKAPETSSPPSSSPPPPVTTTPAPPPPASVTPHPSPMLTPSAPAPTTTAPAPSTTAPAPAPSTTAPAPVPTTTAPAPSTAAPAPSTIAPAPSTIAPAPSITAPAPAPSTTAPAPSTAAPAPSTIAPAPSTKAPAPSTIAPAPSTKAPAPSTTAPTPSTVPAPPVTSGPPAPTTARPAPSVAPHPTMKPPTAQTARPVVTTASPQRPSTPATASPAPTPYRPGNVMPDRNTASWWYWWSFNKNNKKWADIPHPEGGSGKWWATWTESSQDVASDSDNGSPAAQQRPQTQPQPQWPFRNNGNGYSFRGWWGR